MPAQGKFIVIDGGEGTGTTSVSKYVVGLLNNSANEVPIIYTREPGGSGFAEKVRAAILAPEAKETPPEALFYAFWAARIEHLHHTVLPALDRGSHVFCDRFDSSTWAYQIVAQERPALTGEFWEMRSRYVEHRAMRMARPAHYIVLDASPEVALARIRRRRGAKTHFDQRSLEFHHKVRAGFLDFVDRIKLSTPCSVVDASGPENQVQTKVLNIVQKVLKGD